MKKNNIKSENEKMLKISIIKFDQEERMDTSQPIVTRNEVLNIIVNILSNSHEERRKMLENLHDKLGVYLSQEESNVRLVPSTMDFSDDGVFEIQRQVLAEFVFYISAEIELLYKIYRKARANGQRFVHIEGIVRMADSNDLKELITGQEHELEIYRDAKWFRGYFIAERTREYFPQRYSESKVVGVYNKNGMAGVKIIPSICRVDKAKLPILRPKSERPDKNAEKEIRDWVDETVRVNEEGIELDKHINKEFAELKDNIYMTLKYTENDKKTHYPCKEFHGFLIVYMIQVIVDGIRFWKEVNADLFQSWNIDLETLHSIACANTVKDYKPILRTLADASKGVKNNLLLGDKPRQTSKGYVLRNTKDFYGVGMLAYPGMLDKIAKILNDDFYFYARNSIFICITACNENYDGSLLNLPALWDPMVHEEDAFSPYVHKYNRKTKEIENDCELIFY